VFHEFKLVIAPASGWLRVLHFTLVNCSDWLGARRREILERRAEDLGRKIWKPLAIMVVQEDHRPTTVQQYRHAAVEAW